MMPLEGVLGGLPIEEHNPKSGLCPHGYWKDAYRAQGREACQWCTQIRALIQEVPASASPRDEVTVRGHALGWTLDVNGIGCATWPWNGNEQDPELYAEEVARCVRKGLAERATASRSVDGQRNEKKENESCDSTTNSTPQTAHGSSVEDAGGRVAGRSTSPDSTSRRSCDVKTLGSSSPERDAVVAWLRSQARGVRKTPGQRSEHEASALLIASDCVARGDHMKGRDSASAPATEHVTWSPGAASYWRSQAEMHLETIASLRSGSASACGATVGHVDHDGTGPCQLFRGHVDDHYDPTTRTSWTSDCASPSQEKSGEQAPQAERTSLRNEPEGKAVSTVEGRAADMQPPSLAGVGPRDDSHDRAGDDGDASQVTDSSSPDVNKFGEHARTDERLRMLASRLGRIEDRLESHVTDEDMHMPGTFEHRLSDTKGFER